MRPRRNRTCANFTSSSCLTLPIGEQLADRRHCRSAAGTASATGRLDCVRVSSRSTLRTFQLAACISESLWQPSASTRNHCSLTSHVCLRFGSSDGYGGIGTRPDCGFSEALPDDCFGEGKSDCLAASVAHQYLLFQKIAMATGSASSLRRTDTVVSAQKASQARHARNVRLTSNSVRLAGELAE